MQTQTIKNATLYAGGQLIGPVGGVVLTLKESIPAEAVAELKAAFEKQYSGQLGPWEMELTLDNPEEFADGLMMGLCRAYGIRRELIEDVGRGIANGIAHGVERRASVAGLGFLIHASHDEKIRAFKLYAQKLNWGRRYRKLSWWRLSKWQMLEAADYWMEHEINRHGAGPYMRYSQGANSDATT